MKTFTLARAVAAACLAASLAPAPAMARQPSTRLEIVGNYAGRALKLEIDGKVVFEGYGHLEPPGVTWTLTLSGESDPAPLKLDQQDCETFSASIPRDGKVHTLLIQGCEVKLLS